MTIYDCFSFFNELDILDIRLAELYPVVDRFVLVESTHTHSGQPKPLYYGDNRHRWAPYNDKIIHVVAADMPTGEGIAATRRREMFQRNAILRGLMEAGDEDIALISDADEIPRQGTIEALKDLPDGAVITYQQKLYYFNFNTYAPDRPWPGTRAARVADIRALSPHVIRNGLGQPDGQYPLRGGFPNGGWHLSYFGDVAHIQNKMRAFLHQELVTEEALDGDTIARRMAAGLDIWGREGEQKFVIGPASDLPLLARCDPARFAPYYHPDWRPVFTEDWYDAACASYLGWLAQQCPPEGAIVEIGCWEGKSTVALAQAVAPRIVHCVDHFQGNADEKPEHPATGAASERDVGATFIRNMDVLTAGNVQLHIQDWREWAAMWKEHAGRSFASMGDGGIAFLHLDASHDYESVKDCLMAVLPYLVPGAIICGDDAYAGGVYQATRDVLGGGVQEYAGRLWVWQKEE